MKYKLLLITFFTVLFSSVSSYGQIAAWDFTGENTANATSTAEVYNASMDASNLITRGAGATATAAGNSFRTAGFQNNGISTANTDYFQVTLSASTGNVMSLSTIDARFAGTGTFAVSPGVSNQFAYSLDGTTFTLISTPQILIGTTATLTQIDLSGIAALQNVAATVTVTLRFYASGQTTTGGWGFNSPAASAYGLAIGGTVTTAGITTRQNGDWYDPNTWTGLVVPTSAQNAIINHTVTNTTISPANITRDAGVSTTINNGSSLSPGAFTYTNTGTTAVTSGGSLIISNTYTNTGTTTITAGTVQINQGAIVATNAFSYSGATTLILNGSSGLFAVSTPVNFWPTSNSPLNVTVQGTGAQINNPVGTVAGTLTVNSQLNVSVASGLTVSGTALVNTQLNVTTASGLLITGILQLNSSGFINTNSPVYGASSTLRYNTSYSRNLEWTQDVATIGTTPGYPNNVHVTNNSTLTYYNVSNNGPKGMNGNLTIDVGSTLTFTGTSTAGALTVTGNVANAGTLSLGSVLGDDIKTAGNFANTGTFTANNRAIWFIKAGTQTVSSTSPPFTIPYVVTNNGTTVQLLNAVIISAPLNGNAIDFKNASDKIDLNGFALTVGGVGVNSIINGSGSFIGNINSDLTLNGGNGSIGTIKMVTNFNLKSLTLNRQAGIIGCVMGSAVTINNTLTLTAGLIDLSNTTMTLAAGVNPTGTASSYIIADVSGPGYLRKNISALGSQTFPIGSGGTQYTPATINLTAGTLSSAYLSVAVENSKDPNMGASSIFLNRYWEVFSSGITSPTYTFTGTYIPGAFPATGDVSGGTLGNLSNQWNGTSWLFNSGTPIAGTVSINGTSFSGNDHYTSGRRNQEINIKEGVTNVPSGSTFTNFGTVTYGGSAVTVTFTIENLGQNTLTLGTGTLTGANYSTNYTTGLVTGFSSTTFTITVNPTATGVLSGSISIVNNDADENPYVINFQCTITCPTATITSVTPASGPVNTIVTITAAAGPSASDFTGCTVNFGGIAATVISSTATQLVVRVPAGATTGNINIVKTVSGCITSTPFTVIKKVGNCNFNELIMTEIYDSPSGSLGYLEVYNGTGSTINLSTYFVRRYADNASLIANTYTDYFFSPGIASITAGQVRYGRISTDPNTASPNFDYTNSGFAGINGDDIFYLYNGATLVDVYIVPNGTAGYTAKRNITTTGPNATSNPGDWTHTNTSSLTDLGTFNITLGNQPTTTNPADVNTCNSSASFTVTGTLAPGPGGLAFQWYYTSGLTAGWTAVASNSFTGVVTTNFATNTLNLSGAIGSYNGYQFYCTVIQNGTCGTASNAAQLIVTASIWNGGPTWVGGAPSLTRGAIINADYDTAVSGNFDACSVTINPSRTLTIRTGNFVTIQNNLFVNSTASLIVENNGSLVMIDDLGVVTNNGTTQIKRTATGIRGFDYVYWSSPVLAQSIDTFYSSPAPGYKYKWNALANNINSPTSSGTWQLMSGNMTPGYGYIVRGSSSYGMAASSIPGVFGSSTTNGAVNNGVISPFISRGSYQGGSYLGASGATVTNLDDNWNLVGNPYPSSIKATEFLKAANNPNIQGFINLWTHGTAPVSTTNPFYNSFVYNYTSNDYITYNAAGASTGPSVFNGNIAAGQGFFVMMNDGPISNGVLTVNFKNSMRYDPTTFVGYANNQFYKNAQMDEEAGDEKSRIWLDLLDSNNQPVRTMVGYMDEATIGLDRMYDAQKSIENEMNIYSLVEDQTLIIQGRPIPFDVNDQVPVGVRIMQDGAYKIAIGAVDGLFDGDQNIYLEDKLLGVIYDLRQSPYNFNATAGKSNDRFVLRYTNSALGNPNFGNLDNSVVVSTNHGEMNIKSYIETIQDVTVYDILGRELFAAKNIGNNNFMTSNISMSQQALIVKIKLNNGVIVTRKVVL